DPRFGVPEGSLRQSDSRAQGGAAGSQRLQGVEQIPDMDAPDGRGPRHPFLLPWGVRGESTGTPAAAGPRGAGHRVGAMATTEWPDRTRTGTRGADSLLPGDLAPGRSSKARGGLGR